MLRACFNNRSGTFTDATWKKLYPMGAMGAGAADLDTMGTLIFTSARAIPS
ncbi:MAG: hypothetical protein WKF37_11135 [Bryobacteraceae bacterium]